MEIVVDRTNYIIKKYSKNDNGDWELSGEEYHYYSAEGRDLGQMECSFAHGTIYNGSGNMTELQPGDTVRCEIDGIGSLTNTVR